MIKTIISLLVFLIILTGFSLNKDEKTNGNQRAYYQCSEPMDIDTNLVDLDTGKTYFYFDTTTEYYTEGEDPQKYFRAYLINNKSEKFTAKRQDESLIMIQEALDENGNWLPIEYWVYSGCGNSYFNPLELDSGKYVMIPIRKYSGYFNTKIRLKMKKDSTLFYSQPFEGSIDKEQFQKETNQVHGILYHGKANYLDEN